MKLTPENKKALEADWENSTTAQYLKNLKRGMGKDQAMATWKFQNRARNNLSTIRKAVG